MPVRRYDADSFAEVIRDRSRPEALATERAAVADICARVRAEGDAALRELGRRFDGWAPAAGESFEADMESARLDAADEDALEFAAHRIRAFHERQLPQSESDLNLRLLTRPVARAGVYAPGGRAAYPSTVLMTAIPARVAADLAAQLEHDPLAWGVLITDSSAVADRVEEELQQLARGLERAEIIRRANCCLVVTRDLDEAIGLANAYAPEHLLVVTRDPEHVAARIDNAGAVFVGPYSTVPLGDYVAGPNHTLPTSGGARFGSPLGVHTFMKRTSVLNLGRDDLVELREATVRLAHLEGLTAHAHAVEVRLE